VGYIKIYKKDPLRADNCYDISASLQTEQTERCCVCGRAPEDLQYDTTEQCYYCDDLCQALDYAFHHTEEETVVVQ
jgi:hypothetical protein